MCEKSAGSGGIASYGLSRAVQLTNPDTERSMLNTIAADFVVLLHFAFILFVGVGGLFVLKWRRLGWFHVPAVLWAALIECTDWVCPLTPLENMLRRASGGGYTSGFIEHYIVPVIYPAEMTRGIQIGLGLGVVVLNAFIYTVVLKRPMKRERKEESPLQR